MHENCAVRVTTNFHRAGCLTLVTKCVHVANNWVSNFSVCLLQNINWTDVCHLVNRRCQRNVGARHFCDAWAPNAACNYDVLCLNATLICDDSLDRAILNFKIKHFGICKDTQIAGLDCALAHECASLQRINNRHARGVVATKNNFVVDERYKFFYFCR